jgi:hypothetical protein
MRRIPLAGFIGGRLARRWCSRSVSVVMALLPFFMDPLPTAVKMDPPSVRRRITAQRAGRRRASSVSRMQLLEEPDLFLVVDLRPYLVGAGGSSNRLAPFSRPRST